MDDVLIFTAYERARSVQEALMLLDEGGEEARAISGGQSLVPLMNLGLASPRFLVDVTAVPELRQVRIADGFLVIGAAVTHHELTVEPLVITHAPLLALAARHIGSQRIRNRGTIGGSIAHGDPAAELPLCCAALGAEHRIQRLGGDEWRSALTFSLGHYQTNITTGELVTAIRIPLRPDFGWGFHEYCRRAGDFALASAAAGVSAREGRVESLFIAVTGATDRPLRLESVERRLAGAPVDEVEGRLAGIAADLAPPDDPYSAGVDRARLIEALVTRAVRDALHAERDEAGGPNQ